MKRLSKQKKVKLKTSEFSKRKKIWKIHLKRRGNNNKKTNSITWWDRSLDAPVKFDLMDRNRRRELTGFIRDIFTTEQPNEVLRLSFKYTEDIMVDALLLFVSRLSEALLQKDKFSSIRISPSTKRSINAVLTQTEVLSMCGQDFDINPSHESVVNWDKLDGNIRQMYKAENIHDFFSGINKKDESKILIAGVKEALTNIKYHAYDETKEGSWSIFIRKKKGEYVIVVCDLGVGIPTTIKNGKKENQKSIWEAVKNKFGMMAKDSTLIEASMEHGYSRTADAHRGKGLPKMKQAIESASSTKATLRIYSNRGYYAKINQDLPPILLDYKDSIEGTVVTWKIPVNTE